jgi:protein-S-isoprenylcysteine O-methyltransferase Ste14
MTARTEPAREAVLMIGPLRLTGRSARFVSLALTAGLVFLLAHYRDRIVRTPMTISAVLWIAFQVYWSVAAAKTLSTVRSESARSRAFHQYLMLLGFFLLFAPLPWLDRRLLPAGAVWVVLGLALQAGFFGLAISARRTLGRNWSGAITEKKDHELIRSGPYRFVRHPIYTAIIGMFLGSALVSGDVHAFLAVAVIVAAYVRKIGLEERTLAQVFGPRYDEYRQETRALIPWIL